MRSKLLVLLALLGLISVSSCQCVEPVAPPVEPPPPEASAFEAWRTNARRLTVSELDNTLRDVFGDDTGPASRLLSEDEFAPFDNDYSLQEPSAALIESLEIFAEDVAVRATAPGAERDALVGCVPTGPGDAECLRSFITRVGELALRRPLAADEVERYMAFQAFATEDNSFVDNDFYTAVQLVIRALVIDPEFLYRVEVGTPLDPLSPEVRVLNNHEIAARMSYLLWGSTPDRALLDDAAAGSLGDPQERAIIAQRMLVDARARQQVRRFHAMWLGYRAIPHPPELTAAFNRETGALLDRVIFDEDRSYLDVFLMDETFLDDTLADHYGLPRPEGGEGWVPYEGTERSGILGHGSVLAAFSKFNDTSPTQRGIFVKERLLCEPILPPPPTVDVDQPPDVGSDACKVDRYIAHMGSGSCFACHSQMDPIGLGLEGFDVAGRARDTDDGRPDCPIDYDGELPGFGAFRGPAQLAEKIVEEQLVQECVVKQFVTFGIGRAPSSAELVEVQRLAEGFTGDDHSFESLLLAFVSSDAFALRKDEVQ